MFSSFASKIKINKSVSIKQAERYNGAGLIRYFLQMTKPAGRKGNNNLSVITTDESFVSLPVLVVRYGYSFGNQPFC
ncbi:MAG TPA: hypothetical protein DHW64_03450 [Chitinophagaceae bacterium]|nr:hypothetical protein [Chitinophagaceae bacterium]